MEYLLEYGCLRPQGIAEVALKETTQAAIRSRQNSQPAPVLGQYRYIQPQLTGNSLSESLILLGAAVGDLPGIPPTRPGLGVELDEEIALFVSAMQAMN